jgi:hypothetical protein
MLQPVGGPVRHRSRRAASGRHRWCSRCSVIPLPVRRHHGWDRSTSASTAVPSDEQSLVRRRIAGLPRAHPGAQTSLNPNKVHGKRVTYRHSTSRGVDNRPTPAREGLPAQPRPRRSGTNSAIARPGMRQPAGNSGGQPPEQPAFLNVGGNLKSTSSSVDDTPRTGPEESIHQAHMAARPVDLRGRPNGSDA